MGNSTSKSLVGIGLPNRSTELRSTPSSPFRPRHSHSTWPKSDGLASTTPPEPDEKKVNGDAGGAAKGAGATFDLESVEDKFTEELFVMDAFVVDDGVGAAAAGAT